MRLQLTVQRHALPPTNILWTVRVEDPTSDSAHPSATIAQLLEDVNDIVQLESDSWGLEDYVVEVGGYECLHFQPIHSVLKEDDKITIRALQTTDLRVRKIGGRHQISIDGKHLFDGVAFGRPYLRKTARPTFRIPPRKKRKLDLGHGQYLEDDSIVQTLLPLPGDTIDAMLAEAADGARSPPRGHIPGRIVEIDDFERADHYHARDEDADESDFDTDHEYLDEDEEMYEGKSLELSEELKALLEDDPSEGGQEEQEEIDQPVNSPPEVDSVDATLRHKKRMPVSGDTSDEGNITSLPSPKSSSCALHTNTNVQPTSHLRSGATSDLVFDGNSDVARPNKEFSDDFHGFDGNYPSSDTDSSEVTSSKLEDDTESSHSDSSISRSATSDSTSSSGPESDSDSESDDESSRHSSRLSISHAEPVIMKGHDLAGLAPLSIPHGQGSKKTRDNNERNRKRKRLKFLKSVGVLAPDAGFRELLDHETSLAPGQSSHDPTEDSDQINSLEVRRSALLEKILPAETKSDTLPHLSASSSTQAASNSMVLASAIPRDPTATNSAIGGNIPRQRTKLDVESSRRMVFGSLGLRNPKTPAAEEELRTKLASRGKNCANNKEQSFVTTEVVAEATNARPVPESRQRESWSERLDLSAVECEQEGRILSQPPFPFVQHWEQTKQDEHRYELNDELSQHKNAHLGTWQKANTVTEPCENGSTHIDVGFVRNGAQANRAVQNHLIQGKQQELSKSEHTTSSNGLDLPLVSNFDDLAPLRPADAVACNIIAFKQLDMSKDTSWQPQVSAYRTAKVSEVLEDGTLRILLAERDRTPRSTAPVEQAGKRIFDKFEMPFDDEESFEDTGFRDFLYKDLIEPKLVEKSCRGSSASCSENTNQPSQNELETRVGSFGVQISTASGENRTDQSPIPAKVSTPRQREISNIITEAGFRSGLDSELYESSSEPQAMVMHIEDDSQFSPPTAECHFRAPPVHLDGTSGEVDASRLDSPLYAGGDSSFGHAEHEGYDKSSDYGQRGAYSSKAGSEGETPADIEKDVPYPKLPHLVADEGPTSTINRRLQSSNNSINNSIRNGRSLVGGSGQLGGDASSTFESRKSSFDSLKSTIPPSADVGHVGDPPSPVSSQITNPIYDRLDVAAAFSDDDLPSLDEITSTARSRRVSPPPLRKEGKQKKRRSTSPASRSGSEGRSSTGITTPTQISSRFEPSQIPPESQFVDLTLSSDAISPVGKDDEYGFALRHSARIKQSSSQIEAKETFSNGAKTEKRRLVRGRSAKQNA